MCVTPVCVCTAVDRSLQASIADAREAFVNAVCDILNSYKAVSHGGHGGTLFAPSNLILFPLYILGLLKSVSLNSIFSLSEFGIDTKLTICCMSQVAFRLGQSTRTDDRVFALYQMKCVPLDRLMQIIYPDLYAIHNINTMSEAVSKNNV